MKSKRYNNHTQFAASRLGRGKQRAAPDTRRGMSVFTTISYLGEVRKWPTVADQEPRLSGFSVSGERQLLAENGRFVTANISNHCTTKNDPLRTYGDAIEILKLGR